MRKVLVLLALLTTVTAHAAVTANDDSCDLATLPAATLLLPYFEVDLEATPGDGRTTLFTVVNVSREPQIARVTLWTDLSFPVFTFNLFLTGYDVQSINMYDILVRGVIAPPNGANSRSTPGARSLSNTTGNPRFYTSAEACGASQNEAGIHPLGVAAIQAALTTGVSPLFCPDSGPIGTVHGAAIGYATIDLVADCGAESPADATYGEFLLYDNVLTGDYQHISGSGEFANGNPLVHLRAIPEGGLPGASHYTDTALPRTFYGGHDRRQPLPTTFAARYIDAGATSFATTLQFWTGRAVRTCGQTGVAIPPPEVVRFDERENPSSVAMTGTLPATSRVPIDRFPILETSDVAGWMYINTADRQSWISSVMSAEGRYSTSQDVVALGNGCSPAVPLGSPIEPRPNANPRAANIATSPANTNNDDSCDVGLYPAATLLLPYFEVDVDRPASVSRTTLFAVTNVTAQPQIAHVTIWTDYGYPVLSFNIFLTGYDVQSINLADVLNRGLIAPDQGTSNEITPGARSASNIGGNPNFLPAAGQACTGVGQSRGRIPEVLRQNTIAALTQGVFPLVCGAEPVGSDHERYATGYLTIDVVATCTSAVPTEARYYDELLYDNVLTGDYQHVDPDNTTGNYAQGSPMVHIRATPEGGAAGAATPTNLTASFYEHYVPGHRDRRQPLPSVFAARWIEGNGMSTNLQFWRQSTTGTGTNCNIYDVNGAIQPMEIVAFDERENPFVLDLHLLDPPPPIDVYATDLAESLAATDERLPRVISGDVAGWFYINLAEENSRPAWVTTRMSAQGRFSVLSDATAMGNGCSAVVPARAVIAPLP
ncbi:MAG TPA: hypothetical protein VGF69_16830 [Thermoanaerobaculia bacterium]